MRITTLLSAATFLASVCTAFADAPTISELIELSGVATGPSEYNEEGYRQLAALIQAANIPTPTAPEVRSEDIILERMTNGERLAKGLPLKAPIRRRSRLSLNRRTFRSSISWQRKPDFGRPVNPRVIPQAIASPAPRQTVTGFLGFKDAAGQKVGYVRNTMVNNAQAAFTISQSQAVKVSITFDSSESLPSRLRVSLLVSHTFCCRFAFCVDCAIPESTTGGWVLIVGPDSGSGQSRSGPVPWYFRICLLRRRCTSWVWVPILHLRHFVNAYA